MSLSRSNVDSVRVPQRCFGKRPGAEHIGPRGRFDLYPEGGGVRKGLGDFGFLEWMIRAVGSGSKS